MSGNNLYLLLEKNGKIKFCSDKLAIELCGPKATLQNLIFQDVIDNQSSNLDLNKIDGYLKRHPVFSGNLVLKNGEEYNYYATLSKDKVGKENLSFILQKKYLSIDNNVGSEDGVFYKLSSATIGKLKNIYKILLIYLSFLTPVCFLSYSYILKNIDIISFSIATALLFTAAMFTVFIVKNLNDNIIILTKKFLDISKLEFENLKLSEGKDEISYCLDSLISLQISIAISREINNQNYNYNHRVLSALDSGPTGVLLIDIHGKIIYINKKAKTFFATTGLPNSIGETVSTKLIGDNYISSKKYINKNDCETKIKIDSKSFSIKINPLYNEKSECETLIIEIEDITSITQAEESLQSVLLKSQEGEFDYEINVEGFDGFLASIASSLNNILKISHNGLTDILHSIEGLSSGDLTRERNKKYLGIFDKLNSNLNKVCNTWISVVNQLKSTCFELKSVSEKLNYENNELKSASDNQNSDLHKISAAVEEILATVNQTAMSTKTASSLVSETNQTALLGGTQVQNVIESMDTVSKTSKKIDDIVSLIDSIAFQTNLLALNASVEAARAGEHGRGFSVVASEVRNLSQRCGMASKEIRELITVNSSQIKNSVDLVHKAGDTIKNIIQSVTKVNENFAHIQMATQEEVSAIHSVSDSISNISENNNSNTALVTTLAAQSTKVAELAESLNGLFKFFRTE